jgi:signal transduction histidine kinase
VTGARMAFWTVLAEDQQRAVETALDPGPLPVAVSAEDLAAAVDALLGNVFAHTDEGVAFSVTLRARPDGAELVVEDHGTGFEPAAERRGVSGAGSTGLGLDIARRTAESSGGSLRIERTPRHRTRVTVVLLTDR